MSFTPTVVSKAGKADRVARTPVELVQYEFEGWKAVRTASQKVVAAVVGPEQSKTEQ